MKDNMVSVQVLPRFVLSCLLEEYVSKCLDVPSTTGVVIISYELSQAFDKPPHEQILRILDELAFPSGFIEWKRSHLHQRTQFVRIGEHHSKLVNVPSGVPQGSIIGPPLFVTAI